MSKRRALAALLIAVSVLASGCAAAQVALEHKDLAVQTQMSSTVFLPPAPPDRKTVWVEVRNTSDQELDLSALTAMIASRGYKIVSNSDQANYHLQVNVLYVGRDDKSAIRQSSLYGGYGGPLGGAAVGGVIGAGAGGDARGAVIGAVAGSIVGGVAELVAGSLVKKVTYTLVTDVQIAERSATPVVQVQTAAVGQGTATTVSQTAQEISGWKLYRTRVVSTATKMNLEFPEARAKLTEGLLRSLANVL